MSQDRERLTVGFIGAGAVGTSLATAVARAGYAVVAAASRRGASAQALAARIPGCVGTDAQGIADAARLVFVAVPDDAIEEVASRVKWTSRHTVVHCSGARTTGALEAARKRGAGVGGFHPLHTFAGPTPDAFAGITFGIEAEGDVKALLEEMALSLGGRPVTLPPEAKALYHASAVMACGYLTALLDAASGLWESFGRSRDEGLEALLPLARATVENVARLGPAAALTGPLARGDVGTLRDHLAALSERASGALPVYRELGLLALGLADARESLDGGVRREMETLLRQGRAVGDGSG